MRMTKKNLLYRRIAESSGMSLIIGVVYFYIIPSSTLTPKTILVLSIATGYTIAFLWRILYKFLIGDEKLSSHILFLGYTQEIQELVDILQKQPTIGYKVDALFDPELKIKSEQFPGISIYHSLHALRPAITNHKINMVVTAPHLNDRDDALRELYELLFWSVHITDLTSFYETVTGRIPPCTFSESWFLHNLKTNEQPAYNKIRRFFDMSAAVVLGTLFIILFPFIYIGIKLSSPGPIFFKQKRIGLNGKIFFMYKFRTMYCLATDGSAEINGAEFAKKDDRRITSFGNILRKTRIDELPQIFNLLKGDVSIIGPRPERPEIVEQLESKVPYYSLRYVVKPGITGWAAVHQHYTDTMETSLQKLQYDLYYIKNRSFLLDISILLKTINVVIRGMGQ